MATSPPSAPRGAGIGTYLALALIGLKLTDVISWSWFWILSPIWLSFISICLWVLGTSAITAYKKAKGEEPKDPQYSGLGFASLLTLLFIALQQEHFIHWPLMGILAPTILNALLCLVIFFVTMAMAVAKQVD